MDRCGLVAVGWSLWVGRSGLVALGWSLWVGRSGLVALGWVKCSCFGLIVENFARLQGAGTIAGMAHLATTLSLFSCTSTFS